LHNSWKQRKAQGQRTRSIDPRKFWTAKTPRTRRVCSGWKTRGKA